MSCCEWKKHHIIIIMMKIKKFCIDGQIEFSLVGFILGMHLQSLHRLFDCLMDSVSPEISNLYITYIVRNSVLPWLGHT